MTHILQNTVLPTERDPDLLPLYVDPRDVDLDRRGARARLQPRTAGQHPRSHHGAHRRGATRVVRHLLQRVPRVVLAALDGPCATVTLTVRTNGPATILVYRSTGSGVRQRIDTHRVDGESTATFELTLNPYSDPAGGSGSTSLRTRSLRRSRGRPGRPRRNHVGRARRASASRPTTSPITASAPFARWRPASRYCRFWTACSSSIRAIVWCPQSGYEEVAAALGDTLQIVTQPTSAVPEASPGR